MTIASTTNRNDYVGNGAVSSYAYGYRIFANTDLLVTVRNTSDVETTLTLTTDYTVSGVGDLAGGSISLVNASQAWLTAGKLTTDYVLTIRRVRPLTQSTDIRNQGEYFPETIEDSLDHLVMIQQQIQDALDRSLTLPETISPASFDTTIPATVADNPGASFIINDDGDGLILGPTADEISSAQTYATSASSSATAAAASASAASSSASSAASSASAAAASAVAASPTTTKGDLIVRNSTVNQRLAVGANDTILVADSTQTAGIKWASPNSSKFDVFNLGISASVAANALTIALKQSDGTTDPSTGTAAVKIGFRSSTLTSGAYNQRSATAATSVVVSSGSTLGTINSVASYIYIYAIDNAGTVELAVSSSPDYDDGRVYSTTAEGGAGAADSLTAIYSTTARSNVPLRLIGRLLSTQTTAGTWAAAMTEVVTIPFSSGANVKSEIRLAIAGTTTAGYGSTNTQVRRFTTVNKNVGSYLTLTQSAANGDSITVNKSGVYHISACGDFASSTYIVITLNNTAQTGGGSDNDMIIGYARAGETAAVSTTRYLTAGDVIRYVVTTASVSASTQDSHRFNICEM